MTLTTAVAFEEAEAQTSESPAVLRAIVTVDDSDHPHLRATFTYLASVIEPRGASWALVGLAIGPQVDLPIGKHLVLTVTEVRDLPVSRWQQAARAAATAEVSNTVTAGFAAVSRALRDVAEAFGAPLNDRRAQRRLESRVRLVRIAREYRGNVAAGLTDPAGAIARDRGMNPSTVRSLVRRARAAGFLGPAIGPTPGEQEAGET
jgi:hypothetical protein